jgi:hypothetical protein
MTVVPAIGQTIHHGDRMPLGAAMYQRTRNKHWSQHAYFSLSD